MGHESSVAVGLLASLIAAALLSAGMVMQALESRQVDDRHGLRLTLLGQLVRRPRWLAGTLIGYGAFPFQVLAFASAPLIVVQPVHACGLLLVLALGSRLMHERVGRLELVGVAAIVAGVGMFVWGAPPGGEAAAGGLGTEAASASLVLLSFSPLMLRERCGRLTLMACAGLGFAGANLAVKAFTAHLAGHDYIGALACLALAAIGSTVGTLSQMTAFQRHRAVEVVPITFVVPVFLPVLLATFVLHERWASGALGGAPFAAGAAMLLLGASVLACARPVVEIARRAAL